MRIHPHVLVDVSRTNGCDVVEGEVQFFQTTVRLLDIQRFTEASHLVGERIAGQIETTQSLIAWHIDNDIDQLTGNFVVRYINRINDGAATQELS